MHNIEYCQFQYHNHVDLRVQLVYKNLTQHHSSQVECSQSSVQNRDGTSVTHELSLRLELLPHV